MTKSKWELWELVQLSKMVEANIDVLKNQLNSAEVKLKEINQQIEEIPDDT